MTPPVKSVMKPLSRHSVGYVSVSGNQDFQFDPLSFVCLKNVKHIRIVYIFSRCQQEVLYIQFLNIRLPTL